mgnify:CR=1 FL=1
MIQEIVTLRCDDGQEAVVFRRYKYNHLVPSYEIALEDSYIGGEYKGLLGRLKRAWRAFIDKPVTYTGVITEDKEKVRKFLTESLAILDHIEETS